MFDNKGRFIIEDYSNKSTFASFLPGISGEMGIPIWCFYVNRGQGICSFGVRDKDHSIMEFYPAHQAYQNTSTVGFRTFLKIDGNYYEPFYKDGMARNMYIGANEMEVEEINDTYGIQTNIGYYTLPNEDIGGLVRKVTLKNLSNQIIDVDILDGMPAVIPYGVGLQSMKNMAQTTKAWMQVEDVDVHMPYYRVRVSMDDSAEVSEVEGGNFYCTILENGTLLPVIVDPQVVFAQNTAMTKANGFINNNMSELFKKPQVCQNTLPSGFFGGAVKLGPQEQYTFYSVIGEVSNKEKLQVFKSKIQLPNYFEEKYEQAHKLTSELCKAIETKTASKTFDAYCKQTYLDNILRGGHPILLGEDSVYHIYSRKHGDIERDYNYFCMSPEFYSQGNANFRDVNQNRRCDTFFTPYVKDYNIKTFYNLIQLDGYNPLGIQGMTYTLKQNQLDYILLYIQNPNKIGNIFNKPFTPGSLLKYIGDKNIILNIPKQEFLDKVIQVSQGHMEAVFGEGYWTDHWTYNLDLIETYLAIYPEDESRLMFEDNSYTYFESGAFVRPRSKRYVRTNKGIRQYNAVDHHIKKNVEHKQVRKNYGKGDVYTSNLFEKLMTLATNKFATLDSYGMGIEMEGGKPGWYDALNGMPGLFGSSMAESYEVYRMIEFMIEEISRYKKDIYLPVELITFIKSIRSVLSRYNKEELTEIAYWNSINELKEAYRACTLWGIDGNLEGISFNEVLEILTEWLTKMEQGITRALTYGEGICPTYFAYDMTSYEIDAQGHIVAKAFDVIKMPHFLEGPVRFLKLRHFKDQVPMLYQQVKNSKLYDEKLKMYKVNTSLEESSFEIGRAKAFTPGWLENESIWLHMEYKYLLEALKTGLYKEYFEDLKTTCIPFLDPKVYGRSILENSSFIASSANPDQSIHGRGFVARLSGSTAEFIHMWQIMMCGKSPFTVVEDKLCLRFEPAIPEYLIDEKNEIRAKFLGTIDLHYTFLNKGDIIPGKYKIHEINITYKDGITLTIEKGWIEGIVAEDIRSNKVEKIHITVEVN